MLFSKRFLLVLGSFLSVTPVYAGQPFGPMFTCAGPTACVLPGYQGIRFADGSLQTTAAGGAGTTLTMGGFDGASATSNGASIDGMNSILYMQSATALFPGLMNIGAQTFSGTKTFSSTIVGTTSGNTTYTPNQYGIVASGSGNAMSVIAPDASTTKVLVSGGSSAVPSWQNISSALSIGSIGSTPNASGASISGGTLTLQPADDTHPGVVTPGSQTLGGSKTFSAAPVFSSVTASQVLSVDGSKSLTSLGYDSANTASQLVQRDVSGNFAANTITAALTGTASGNTTYTPNQYGIVASGSGNAMSVIAPDASTTKVLVSGGLSAAPSWQNLSGALSIGAFGSSPNSSGASISGGTLTLQPADATNPGGLSTGAQTIAGQKTFSSIPIFSTVVADQMLVVNSSKALTSLGYGANNVVSTVIQRDGFGDFVARTPTLTSVKLSGSTSGTTTLQPSATASGTLTLPATTDTIVTQDFPQGFQNKTIAANSTNVIGSTAIAGTTGTNNIVFSDSPTLNGTPLFSGSTSGTTGLKASATASGTLTLPAATDTLVGKATTDTLTNKTLSTGGTNVIGSTTISGTTGTGNVVFDTTPTFTTSIIAPVHIGGNGVGSSAEIRSTNATGTTDFIKFTTGTNGGTEAMRIIHNGNVGIGVTSPSAGLQVNTGIKTGGSVAVGFLLGSGGVSACYNNTQGDSLDYMATCSSDERLKKNVLSLDTGLDAILKIHPIEYKWKDKHSPQNRQLGFIAQQLEKIIPEAVYDSGDNELKLSNGKTEKLKHVKALNYNSLFAPIVNAIQQFYGQFDELRKENAAMKAYLCKKDKNAPFCH